MSRAPEQFRIECGGPCPLLVIALVTFCAPVFFCGGAICHAQLFPTPGTSSPFSPSDAQAVQPANNAPARYRILVLTSGRIVSGNITPSGPGYLVKKPEGEMFVPGSTVRFEANSIEDAYRKLARSMPAKTATNHIILAKWCLDQHLYSHARAEVRSALVMEPERDDARRMLIRIDAILKPKADPPPVTTSLPEMQNGFGRNSLLGLSRDSVGTFTGRIQPVLLRKCGNLGCHGGRSEATMQLSFQSLRGPVGKRFTEQNLAAILAQVNNNASDSPLLATPLQDGRHPAGLFGGPYGKQQYKLLAAWINRVGAEQTAMKPKQSASNPFVASQVPSSDKMKTTRQPIVDSNVTPASATTTSGLSAYPPLPHGTGPLPHASEGFPSGTNDSPVPVPQKTFDPVLDPIRTEEHRDAFDPREFNSMSP